jgi:hypothetical protein
MKTTRVHTVCELFDAVAKDVASFPVESVVRSDDDKSRTLGFTLTVEQAEHRIYVSLIDAVNTRGWWRGTPVEQCLRCGKGRSWIAQALGEGVQPKDLVAALKRIAAEVEDTDYAAKQLAGYVLRRP